MKLDDVLSSLFPGGHDVARAGGILVGSGTLSDDETVTVIGIAEGIPLGIDEALCLADAVLLAVSKGRSPIVVLVDSDSQRMSKRDELLGLYEFLAHLAKCLMVADVSGYPTIGILYGHTAAGAFLATAMATRYLVGIAGATPAVMDLPSMSKVTKLSISVLEEKARTTPVFAPGLTNLAKMGAVHVTWDSAGLLADNLRQLLKALPTSEDQRDLLGEKRRGRTKAREVAALIHQAAIQA